MACRLRSKLNTSADKKGVRAHKQRIRAIFGKRYEGVLISLAEATLMI